MSNYIYNRLEISGDFDKVINQINSKNELMDFNGRNPIIEGNSIFFRTAQTVPLKTIEGISKKFNNEIFKITWADEEPYCRTGEAGYLRGRCLNKKEFKDNSREAQKAYLCVRKIYKL